MDYRHNDCERNVTIKKTFAYGIYVIFSVDNQYEVPFGHLMPRQQKQYRLDGQLGSMSSMQDHFNSVPPSQPFLSQQIQRSSSMMRPGPVPPLQFYTHTDS